MKDQVPLPALPIRLLALLLAVPLVRKLSNPAHNPLTHISRQVKHKVADTVSFLVWSPPNLFVGKRSYRSFYIREVDNTQIPSGFVKKQSRNFCHVFLQPQFQPYYKS